MAASCSVAHEETTVPEVTLPDDADEARPVKSESIETFIISHESTSAGRRVSYSPTQNFIVESPKTVDGDNEDESRKYRYEDRSAGGKLKSNASFRGGTNVPLINLAVMNPAKYKEYLRQYQIYLQRYQLYIEKILKQQSEGSPTVNKLEAPMPPNKCSLHGHHRYCSAARHDPAMMFAKELVHESRRRSYKHKYLDGKMGKTGAPSRRNWPSYEDFGDQHNHHHHHHHRYQQQGFGHNSSPLGYENSPSRVILIDSSNGFKPRTKMNHHHFHRNHSSMYPFASGEIGSGQVYGGNLAPVYANSGSMIGQVHSNGGGWMQTNDYHQAYNLYPSNNMTLSNVFHSGQPSNKNSAPTMMGSFYAPAPQSYYQSSSSNQYLNQFNSAPFW